MHAPTDVPPQAAQRAWLIYCAAVASSIPALWFYLVGEEGIMVNSSLEMAQRGDWLRLWFYGSTVQHGVFANWLHIALSRVVGWEHVVGALRAIMIASVALSGLILAFLVQRLYRNAVLAALAAAVFVTLGDILLYRGWLGYRDPLLGMLVFGAIAALWLAVHGRNSWWLIATVVLATCAFLTKGIIAYAYVGVAALVFLLDRDARYFLLRPLPVVLAMVTLCMPLAWAQWVGGDQAHNMRLAAEIGEKLAPSSTFSYLGKLLSYPLETLLRLAPLSLLVLWWAWRGHFSLAALVGDYVARKALLIAAIAFVPFWLAPHSHFRYLLPIAPLVALVLAVALYQAGTARLHLAMRWMWAAVALKLLLAVVVFPLYQHRYRGENYAATAREVLTRTADFPLYSNNVSAAGLSVTAYMNIARLPRAALTFAPPQWDNGFVIFNAPDETLGKVAAQYRLAGDTLYLLCRGAACDAARAR